MLKTVTTDTAALKILDDRLRWLSAWTCGPDVRNRWQQRF